MFLTDLQDKVVTVRDHTNVDTAFSTIYRKLDKTANKYAPFKHLSNRKAKQLSKLWITKGIRTSIRLKNKYYKNGERDKYRLYRNIISQLTRHSKSLYYHSFFESNLHSIKQTWKGINNLISSKKMKNKRNITNIKILV